MSRGAEVAYIYAVDESGWGVDKGPRLFRAAILRRTDKRITTDRTGLAFHCRAHHDPARCAFTPDAAWDRYVADTAARIAGARREIADAERALTLAAKRRGDEAGDR